MPLDLDDLASFARAATPGTWSAHDDGDVDLDAPRYPGQGATSVYADDDCEWHQIADCSCNHSCRNALEQQANAAFIAALNPKVVLELIEELRELRELKDATEDADLDRRFE